MRRSLLPVLALFLLSTTNSAQSNLKSKIQSKVADANWDGGFMQAAIAK